MSLLDLAREMAIHQKENPKHGYNCTCKDTQLRKAKLVVANLTPEERGELRYIFHCILRDRYLM